MRRITSGTRLALTLTGATVLATAATSTAYACDVREIAPTTTLQASALDLHVPVNVDVYREFLDARIDALAAYAAALRAKASAIPAGTVLVGQARLAAKAKLAKAAYLRHVLGAIPASGTFAPTPAEQATIAAIRANLAATIARLTALLANRPAVVTPVTTKVLARTFEVKDPTLFHHVCDGHWGDHDATRWGSSPWWWHH